MKGDEAYAGATSYFKLMDASKDITGFKYTQPVHQGRAAEKVLFPILLHKGLVAFSNTFFDTTRAHVELAGGRAIDCPIKESTDYSSHYPFKGDMDINLLQKQIQHHGAKNVGCVVMTITNNSVGGQPVSIKNIAEVSKICKKYKIPLIIDAARYAENAYFVKQRESAYKHMSIIDITRKTFSYADMFTMSCKKDLIVNIGGMLGVKDDKDPIIDKIKANCISYEGFYTYGGLAGRDLEAMAIGMYEGLNEDYLKYRIGQNEYLAGKLKEADIKFQEPAGGHGIFLDAKAMFPHIPYTEFPGQVLAIELYKEAGIRACDIGSYMLGNDPDTGKQLKSESEFTRLAIPRRVYTQAHLDIIVEALINIKKHAKSIKHGLKII
jgi:tryptophanase